MFYAQNKLHIYSNFLRFPAQQIHQLRAMISYHQRLRCLATRHSRNEIYIFIVSYAALWLGLLSHLTMNEEVLLLSYFSLSSQLPLSLSLSPHHHHRKSSNHTFSGWQHFSSPSSNRPSPKLYTIKFQFYAKIAYNQPFILKVSQHKSTEQFK